MIAEETSRVYRFLVSNPGSDIAEISEQLGLSTTEIASAIQELDSLKLVFRSGTASSPQLIAYSPDVALSSLIDQDERKIVELRSYINSQRREFANLVPLYTQARTAMQPISGLEILETGKQVSKLLYECARRVNNFVFDAHPGQGFNADSQVEGIRSDMELISRGVLRRTILDEVTLNHAPTIRAVQELSEVGGKLRVAKDIPVRVVIFDSLEAIVAHPEREGEHAAIYIQDANVVQVLTEYFNDAWNRAVPFEQDIQEDHSLSRIQRAILRGMAAGYSDESVARRLNISIRTYRRQVASLLDLLGAETRFQAGLEAAKRNWV